MYDQDLYPSLSLENLNAEFSPDSAIASTSDDGEPQSHSNDARSPNLDDTGSDCGFGSAFNRSVKSDNSEQNEMNDMPGTVLLIVKTCSQR
jgi:hypothetical protein